MGIINQVIGGYFWINKNCCSFSALIFFEQKVEIIPKDVVKESMLKEPIENVLAVLVPEISEHKDLLKDIEKKAKDATEKIKRRFIKEPLKQVVFYPLETQASPHHQLIHN